LTNPKILVEASPQALVEVTAQRVVVVARESIAAHGTFTMALSGGSTPKALYQLLATEPFLNRIEWNKVHVFFGDERAVPPNDEYSNFRMACEALLDHLPIPTEHVHRMKGESANLKNAAHDYENELRAHSLLDLVLLGMGDDGHTASLFPHSPALDAKSQLCVATPVASLEPHVRRLTLTLPAINAAQHVWLLATGASKAKRLQQVFKSIESGKCDVESTPILGIAPCGEYWWLLDEAAAHLVATCNPDGVQSLSAP
jgi:6-phosphogluconolactonase